MTEIDPLLHDLRRASDLLLSLPVDEYRSAAERAEHEIVRLRARAAKAEADRNQARVAEERLRSEIAAAFRKHGLAADPNALDALVAERDKAIARAERLAAELRIIVEAKPSEWEADVRDQFKEWAQNRARAAVDAAGDLKEASDG